MVYILGLGPKFYRFESYHSYIKVYNSLMVKPLAVNQNYISSNLICRVINYEEKNDRQIRGEKVTASFI